MADKVLRMPVPAAPLPEDKLRSQKEQRIQKAEKQEEKIRRKEDDKLRKAPANEEKLQRKSNEGMPAVDSALDSSIRNKTSGGQPLSSDVRGYMEPRFNADFSNVRIHNDPEAAGLSNQLSARAFTFRNHLFFSREQYQPGTSSGKQLLAHELTHTIQQGHAVQRSPQTTSSVTQPHIQRSAVGEILDWFAGKANHIPGFRMFTVVLGLNPINMESVDRSAANILRALIEFMPGGALVTTALDNHGIFNKVATWIDSQIKALGMVGQMFKSALTRFISGLGFRDLAPWNWGGLWNRAASIFTAPIRQLISFARGVVTDILKMIRNVILKPLAALAHGTRGYDLLKAILGEDPITGEPVPRNAETLIGGFMKLIGQEDVWDNIKKGNAVARTWAWFQGALSGLMGLVRSIPGRIVATITSLTIADIITVAGAFRKIVGLFAGIAGDFFSWGVNTVWNLLEIVFDVVKPGIMVYIKKTGAALKSIIKNPLPFVGNLVNAAKSGFRNFAANFGKHLKAGLISWLTGSLTGVYIPKALSLPELGKFAMSVLGITWAQIRGKIVKVLGPSGETIMKGLETGFDIVVALVKGGPAAAWELIKEKLTGLKDQVISGIVSFVTETVIKKAVPKLISMFIPGAGFISAIISIYDTVMVFVQKISKIIQVVVAFIDSIVAIAAGNISAAAKRVENILAGLLSLAISFFAGFVGLGKVTDKIMGVIEKVRASVDKAIDAAINWIVTKAKALFAKLFGKKDQKDDRTDVQKKKDLDQAISASDKLLTSEDETPDTVKSKLPALQKQYRLKSLALLEKSTGTYVVRGVVNPDTETPPHTLEGDNFKVEGHEAKKPAKATGSGESHHVPVKVLLSFFAKLLKVAAPGFKDNDTKSAVLSQAKVNETAFAANGKGLSAIWISAKAHKQVHSISTSVPDSEVGSASSKAQRRLEKSKILEAEIIKEANAEAMKGGIIIPKTGTGSVMVKAQLNPLLAHTRRDLKGIHADKLKRGEKKLDNDYIGELEPVFGKVFRGSLSTGLTMLARAKLKPKNADWRGSLTALANSTWSKHLKAK